MLEYSSLEFCLRWGWTGAAISVIAAAGLLAWVISHPEFQKLDFTIGDLFSLCLSAALLSAAFGFGGAYFVAMFFVGMPS